MWVLHSKLAQLRQNSSHLHQELIKQVRAKTLGNVPLDLELILDTQSAEITLKKFSLVTYEELSFFLQLLIPARLLS